MYGLIIDNIVTYIRDCFGESAWSEVKYVSGIEQDHYQMDQVYSEGIAHKLIWACHDVTGAPIDEITSNIGYSFYKFLAKYEFNKIVRILGRTFPQFLNGLDNLHEYLKFSFPKLKPPSFYCEHESRTGLTLHYRSKRRGFLHYVKGQIKCVAKELYQTDVEVELLDHENDNAMEHVIMRLHFNNLNFNKDLAQVDARFAHVIESIRITSDIFFDIFPFMIVFNRGMRIRNIGIGLLRVMTNLVGKKINQKFVLMRPFIRFRWEEIMLHSNNIFELMSADPIYDDDAAYVYKGEGQDLAEERMHLTEKEREKFLMLKGQMMYMEEWESICFMGIPVMGNLSQMYKTGLFINDFALHDSSRDLVLASTQQAAELKLLLHQEAQKSQNMTENMIKLKMERKRTDKLLYQLLPRSVAEQLRRGESAVACCEVETIGDAYMVVGGAPLRTVYHAEYVVDCARSFIKAVSDLDHKEKNYKLQIRAGVHSGNVIAGVVGLKMPRYCLFGDTVFIANSMESTGTPMMVQVSEKTLKYIIDASNNVFQFKENGTLETKVSLRGGMQVFKDGTPMKKYLITGKSGNARIPTPRPIAESDDEVEDEEAARQTPTTLAAAEVAKKRRLSYTPVSDAEIESFSRTSSQVN